MAKPRTRRLVRPKAEALAVVPRPTEPVNEITIETRRAWGPFDVDVRLRFRPLFGGDWM